MISLQRLQSLAGLTQQTGSRAGRPLNNRLCPTEAKRRGHGGAPAARLRCTPPQNATPKSGNRKRVVRCCSGGERIGLRLGAVATTARRAPGQRMHRLKPACRHLWAPVGTACRFRGITLSELLLRPCQAPRSGLPLTPVARMEAG